MIAKNLEIVCFLVGFTAIVVSLTPWSNQDAGNADNQPATAQKAIPVPPPQAEGLLLDVFPPPPLDADVHSRRVELTPDQWREIERAAAKRNKSVREYLRSRLLTSTDSHGAITDAI